MRLIFLSFLLISISFAQNTETIDVIYLKDGSVIKGRIIEVIPNESVKIATLGGSVLIFKAYEVKRIKSEEVALNRSAYSKYSYNPERYRTQLNIGRYGWASVAALTLIGSAAMGDGMFATTVITVVGPFVTIIRIENDPGSTYLPGGKELLLASGILQVSFFSYWMYYLIQDSNYKSKSGLSIEPNLNYIGLTLSYKF